MQNVTISTDRIPWHSLQIESVLQKLAGRIEGLTQIEADQLHNENCWLSGHLIAYH